MVVLATSSVATGDLCVKCLLFTANMILSRTSVTRCSLGAGQAQLAKQAPSNETRAHLDWRPGPERLTRS
jgi:hypothetical protein